MKRIIISLLTALTFVSVNAQRQMLVHKTDGSTTTISVDKVSKVYFQEAQESAKDLSVDYTDAVIMNNSFVIVFKFGSDVSTRRIVSYPSTSSLADMDDDELISYIENNADSYLAKYVVYFAKDLGEKVKDYIAVVTYDSSGKQKELNKFNLTTESSVGQPRAQIYSLKHDSTNWTWYVQMNNYCAAFIQVMYQPSSHVNDCDAYLAYLIMDDNDIFVDSITIGDGYLKKKSGSYYADYSQGQCEIVTWGLSNEGYLSKVLERANYGYNSAKAMYSGNTSECFTAGELTADDVKHDRSNIVIVKK